MLAPHLDAENRYELIRKEARLQAESVLPSKIKNSITLSGISQKELVHTKHWAISPNREVDWDWLYGHEIYRKRYPKRFEVAIWYKNFLSGLAIGRPTYHGSKLRLDFAERAPDNCPIKGYVMPVILLSAEAYGLKIGADEVRRMDPMNERLVNYYNRLGYKYVEGTMGLGDANEKNPHFLYKKLGG